MRVTQNSTFLYKPIKMYQNWTFNDFTEGYAAYEPWITLILLVSDHPRACREGEEEN